MKFKIIKAAIAGLILSISSIANAGLITVVFDITNYNDTLGSFSGSDTNNDMLLTLNELDSFNWMSTSYNHVIDEISDLAGFGDFDLSSNTWIPNGTSWINSADDAYFTWNNRNSSVNASWAEVDIVSVTRSSVPEPSTLAIFALGFLGFALRNFKK
ncbi:PEP-CTERM sorting domain-containing protein [Thalassotalea sediminis]|uniref:PEP-CTERM sorting domain-containing protein n=1 Tax=Thalassotalea sediminis TaxID=1759089 RepID=UPI0025722B3C|nr:PEP-CTERM sorting domain-containing protein [Thalassotalea sediminis]